MITNLDKILEKIDALADIVQKGTCSDEEVQKINQAVHNLQLSIGETVERKVSMAINNQKQICQVHFDRIIEKLDAALKDVDIYRQEIAEEKKYFGTINDASLSAVKDGLTKSIEELKESFKEYRDAQKAHVKEINENKRSWRSIVYGPIFGAVGSILLLLTLWYLDHHFKLGISDYLNAPN